MSRTGKYILGATALGLALAVGGALSAQAVVVQHSFGGVANRFQQARYMAYEPRSLGSSDPTFIYFSSIAGGYTMNAKTQNGGTGVQYKEVKGIGAGGQVTALNNWTPPGTQTRVIVTNNSWVVVDVSIAGWYNMQ